MDAHDNNIVPIQDTRIRVDTTHALPVAMDGPIRRAHNKSRAGCLTCKLRRIKCDETKPQCTRCIASKRECEYVEKLPPGARRTRALAVLKPKAERRTTVVTKPHIQSKDSNFSFVFDPEHPLFDNPLDAQYFKLFNKHTSRVLSTYFADDIWNRVILQACHTEEFARYAVVAIAALHKTQVASASSSTTPEEVQKHHTYALLRYAKALRAIRASTGDLDPETTDEYQLRRVLIASLLTTCFESFHGNQTAAITQIITAIKLLFTVRERISPVATISRATSVSPVSTSQDVSSNLALRPSSKRIGNSIIDRELLAAFARLELDAILITRKEVLPQIGGIKGLEDDMLIADMPTQFETLSEARFYRDIIFRRSTSWRARYGFKPYEEDTSTIDVGAPEIPIQLNLSKIIGTPVPYELYAQLLAQLTAWNEALVRFTSAFLPLYARARQQPIWSKEYQGATVLMLVVQAATLRAHESMQNIDSSDDKRANETSNAMLRLIKDLLEAEAETQKLDPTFPIVAANRPLKYGQPGSTPIVVNMFQFESALVWHLFIVATRSLDRVVRREATDILRQCHRRESLWDSELFSIMAEWFIELDAQDERMNDIPDHAATKEAASSRRARLLMTDEEFNLNDKSAWFLCKRITGKNQGYLPIMTMKW